MFNIGSFIVYKKDVCKIIDIKNNYYVLVPITDNSLKISVPVDNKLGFIRNLISKNEVMEIIKKIPDIEVIETNDKLIENEYKVLMNRGTHIDLIKIIKTTYLRNKERLDNNKKIGDKDNNYFNLAEKYLYNEFAIALNMNYDDTKKYVIEQVCKICE